MTGTIKPGASGTKAAPEEKKVAKQPSSKADEKKPPTTVKEKKDSAAPGKREPAGSSVLPKVMKGKKKDPENDIPETNGDEYDSQTHPASGSKGESSFRGENGTYFSHNN